MFNWCFVTLLIWLPAFLHKKTKKNRWMDVGWKPLNWWMSCISSFLFLAFLIYALKEKGLFMMKYDWFCFALSPPFVFFRLGFSLYSGLYKCLWLHTFSRGPAWLFPHVLFSKCFNALHNTSFHLENIFQMLGLGELDDKHLIVGNKNFSYVVPGHTPMPH